MGLGGWKGVGIYKVQRHRDKYSWLLPRNKSEDNGAKSLKW